MVAQECGLEPGNFILTLGDAHIYLNHIDGLKLQLQRETLPLPQVRLAKKRVLNIEFEDIELVNYRHHDFIKFPIAV